MSGHHRKHSGLKGKLRAFSSTSHLKELVRSHSTSGTTPDMTRSSSPLPPMPQLERVSSHQPSQGSEYRGSRRPLAKSSSKSTLGPERNNDYSYMLRERHSADMDRPTSASNLDQQPQAGQPYSFHDRILGAPAASTMSAGPALVVRSPTTPSSRRSGAASGTPEPTGTSVKTASTHHLAASLLKRSGPSITRKPSKDSIPSIEVRPSTSSVASTTSRWFRRGKSRQSGKEKESPSSGYQLDMNFSDLSNFVDLSKVRRPSITSSMGTGESASLSTGPGAGDSGREEAIGPSPPGAADTASLQAGERVRHKRPSFGSGSSPMLREAIAGGVRSVASSLRGSVARAPSSGSMANTDASDATSWPTDYAWHGREPSVKSRRPTALLDEGDEVRSDGDGDGVDYDYADLMDRASVQSAPTFEDRQPLMHFTDPWLADRAQRQTVHVAAGDTLAPAASPDRRNQSLGSLQSTGAGAGAGAGAGVVGGVVPSVEYPPRKSEPWAPPESWAVLPTGLDGGDDGIAAGGGVKMPEPDDDAASSDSDVEADNNVYSLRIYKEDSTFGTFHCRLSTTTAEFMQMAAKKFFISDISRHCLYMQKANGLDRTLNPNERPANILKRYLEQMGYRPEDNITLQGREDNSYLCKFSLLKAAIPRVSPHMEGEVSSFHSVDLRARKLQTVPVFLYAHANKIVALNMSKNPGLNFPADFVQLCGNLRELRLATCQFARFPPSIQHFTQLSFLDLSGNDMRRMRRVPFARLRQLTTLMLRNNRLVELPESLAELSALRVLNVSNNNLSAFPLVVTRMPALEELDVSLNRIPAIPDAISALLHLVRLNVMGNALAGRLPDGLGRLARLEELDVRQNRLQDLGVTSELAGLRLLYTESNLVTRAHLALAGAASVSLRANKLTHVFLTNPGHTLVFLDLSRNQLTELPADVFEHLPMLEHLVLDSNHIVSIPSSVGNLTNLVHLSCANNALSLIPIELTRLEKLATMDLHNNNLKLLPPELWLMPRLAVLNLSSNLLEQVPHPSMLETLRRQHGASSSVRAVAAAAAAAAAAAQRNGSKASLPTRITQGAGTHLSTMSLPNTRQTSPMSRTASDGGAELLSHSTEAQVPERARNRSTDGGRILPVLTLTPPVPAKRYTVSDPPPLSLALRELHLGDNNLDDEVFTLMAFLPELRVLNLSYNELYDLPPSAMAHMRKLNELYLSGTQISTIPEEEPNAAFWRSLRLLNINGNKLQTLPSWLAKIHGLAVLDVGSNVLKYNITNWPYDWNWNWNPSLKYLNFSYNERFEIKGAHLHTKVFHDHAKLMGSNTTGSAPARDLFNFIAREPPKSDCVSDFYQLTDLRVLGLLQLTIMVPLPDEMPNRRIRTTDPIKRVKYGIADTLGRDDRVSAWDLATSRVRMSDEECLFGMFHARESSTSSSAISKYLCDNFLYLFREELDKIADQLQNGPVSAPSDAEAKKAVNFADAPMSSSTADDSPHFASQLSDEQVQAALRRTFLTLNKDLGTHNRQLIAAAAAAEAYAARSARITNNTSSVHGDIGADAHITQPSHRLTSAELNIPGHSSLDPKTLDSANSDDYHGGSTAVVSYIHGRTLHVANVGDALGVVSRRGTPIIMSKRHDPYDVSEIVRIRSIGGYINQQGKVQGQTDVTRAFGYFHLLPYVNADPTIQSLELTEADEFLIMANRPVWDVITPQIAVDIARKHRRDPRLAAARVRDHVISYGVTKSIMVMVIGFGPMFTKNTGRPMRGLSVRDSIYPGVSDHRSKYAITRRMSRSPSSAVASSFGSRSSVSHPLSATEGRIMPGMYPIPGASQTNPLVSPQQGIYDFSDDFDEFSPVHSSRARRQRDRDVNARPGDSTLARLEREVPPPVGEVVLVFTDVKNSTIQWETNQVAMRSAIKVHNSIMRRMLRSIGGYEVKTEGDAFMVSFPTVASALHWCLAVQMMFLNADWPQEILDSPHGCPIYWPPDGQQGGDGAAKGRNKGPHGESEGRHLIYRGLRVRMGMHLGSPVSEEDPVTRRMDYFGPMVNRASRISGAADGGQVYVSQDVMDEVYAIMEIFETADHNGITDMRQIIEEPSLARDVQALKNLNLSAMQVGEIKLKGLESPELVSMVYPAALRGRIDMQISEEEEQQRQKQQQQQQQLHRRRKSDWTTREPSITNAKLARQNINSKALTNASSDNLSQSLPAPYSHRGSVDENLLLDYGDAMAGSRNGSIIPSPRGSFNRGQPSQGQQRSMRELSVEFSASASSADARSRMRQIGDMPLWSAPVSRRSVSMLQNRHGGLEQLESIGEDGTPYNPIYHGSETDGSSGSRGSKDRGVVRAPYGYPAPPSPRPVMFMPSYYAYLQNSNGGSPMWSRQGSFSYFSGQTPAVGYPWQTSSQGGRQLSRGSVDTAMAAARANSAGRRLSYTSDVRMIDLVQLEMLYRIIYRLQILAVEPDTEMVLPSFEYFIMHRDDDLNSYRIHRASTVSIPSAPHPSAPLETDDYFQQQPQQQLPPLLQQQQPQPQPTQMQAQAQPQAQLQPQPQVQSQQLQQPTPTQPPSQLQPYFSNHPYYYRHFSPQPRQPQAFTQRIQQITRSPYAQGQRQTVPFPKAGSDTSATRHPQVAHSYPQSPPASLIRPQRAQMPMQSSSSASQMSPKPTVAIPQVQRHTTTQQAPSATSFSQKATSTVSEESSPQHPKTPMSPFSGPYQHTPSISGVLRSSSTRQRQRGQSISSVGASSSGKRRDSRAEQKSPYARQSTDPQSPKSPKSPVSPLLSQSPRRTYRRHPKKDPNAPEKWRSAYQLFRDDVNRELHGQDIPFSEMSKIHSKRWSELSDEKRTTYFERSQRDKDDYLLKMSIYEQTPEFKQYEEYLDKFYRQDSTVNRVGRPKGTRSSKGKGKDPEVDMAEDYEYENSPNIGAAKHAASSSSPPPSVSSPEHTPE
ncbi:cysteinyl-tRNA synthetase [Coemansia sp. Benny D115]|nr:cysteinyl-tRNA synthetase [Coemansia sp. Benny D115]